jgi:mRNA interferase MazF
LIRGEVWWADFGDPRGSAPALRPAVIVSTDRYNLSNLSTVQVVLVSSTTGRARLPGNVFIPAGTAGISHDSVAMAHQVSTIDRADLDTPIGTMPEEIMTRIDEALRYALAL